MPAYLMMSCQKISNSPSDSQKILAINANKYCQPEPIVKLCGTFFLHSLGNIEWRIHRGLLDSMIKLSWSTNGKKVHVRYSSLFGEKWVHVILQQCTNCLIYYITRSFSGLGSFESEYANLKRSKNLYKYIRQLDLTCPNDMNLIFSD